MRNDTLFISLFKRHAWVTIIFLCPIVMLLVVGQAWALPEAFQLKSSQNQLGRKGDYCLQNRKVTALIAGKKFEANGQEISKGALYSFSLNRKGSDQLGRFLPSPLSMEVEDIKILPSGNENIATVEVSGYLKASPPVRITHRYELRTKWQGLWIETKVTNTDDKPHTFATQDHWSGLVDVKTIGDITVGDAYDPRTKVGYAYSWLEQEGVLAPEQKVELAPGQSTRFGRFLSVGTSPADAFGVVASVMTPSGYISGWIMDTNSEPVTTARYEVKIDNQILVAYPDENGYVSFLIPAESYDIEIYDQGRPMMWATAVVRAFDTCVFSKVMDAASGIQFDLGESSQAKNGFTIKVEGIGDTATPELGPAYRRPHISNNEIHTSSRDFFLPLPPGEYRVTLTNKKDATISQDIRVQSEKVSVFHK